jgi:hypothetical protein
MLDLGVSGDDIRHIPVAIQGKNKTKAGEWSRVFSPACNLRGCVEFLICLKWKVKDESIAVSKKIMQAYLPRYRRTSENWVCSKKVTADIVPKGELGGAAIGFGERRIVSEVIGTTGPVSVPVVGQRRRQRAVLVFCADNPFPSG